MLIVFAYFNIKMLLTHFQLYQTLQMRAQKKPMNNLAMEEISPTLSKGNFQLLPLPGIEGIEEQVCKITNRLLQSIDSELFPLMFVILLCRQSA